MVNIVRVNVDTRSHGGEAHDPGDRWTTYEPTFTEIGNVEAIIVDVPDEHYADTVANQDEPYATVWGDAYTINMQNPGGVAPGTPVYVVIVRYSSGDTFGHTDGLAEVYDVFGTRSEADALAEKITKEAGTRHEPKNGVVEEWNFRHNGRAYPKCWAGYFEAFQNVEVRAMIAL